MLIKGVSSFNYTCQFLIPGPPKKKMTQEGTSSHLPLLRFPDIYLKQRFLPFF